MATILKLSGHAIWEREQQVQQHHALQEPPQSLHTTEATQNLKYRTNNLLIFQLINKAALVWGSGTIEIGLSLSSQLVYPAWSTSLKYE